MNYIWRLTFLGDSLCSTASITMPTLSPIDGSRVFVLYSVLVLVRDVYLVNSPVPHDLLVPDHAACSIPQCRDPTGLLF